MTEEYWIEILKEEDRLIDNSDRKYRYHCKSLESMSEELTFQERYIDTEEDFTILCGIRDFTDLVQNEELAAGLRALLTASGRRYGFVSGRDINARRLPSCLAVVRRR